MGILQSLSPFFPEEVPKSTKNEAIEIAQLHDQLRALYTFKILVLGAGESGKSTVIKQLRFIHKKFKLQGDELVQVKKTLSENTFECFKAIFEAAKSFNHTFPAELQDTVNYVLDEETDKVRLSYKQAEDLLKLWDLPAIKQTMENRDKFWILDSYEYYVENLLRFAEDNFVPSEEDYVMARVRTTGIVQTDFDVQLTDNKDAYDGTAHFEVIDVGGQRNERRKWINCFDNVKAIIYVSNLAGYNMVLFEQDNKNRLVEDIELFQDVVTKENFRNTPIFLFMNKKDLFESQIKKVGVEACFPEYKGSSDVTPSMEYILSKFREKMPPENPHLYHNYISSRVRQDVKFAFQDVRDQLLKVYEDKLATESKAILKQLKQYQQ